MRFAAFTVDPKIGELRKHGLRIKLQDQPFRVLVALLDQPGEVVTREELRQHVWGNDTFVDFDHGLSAAVNRLRAALGDSAENPKYIETVAKRGYRFIAEVAGPALAETAPPPKRNLSWKPSAALAALLLAVAVIWISRTKTNPPPRLIQLTALTGSESMPALSPDGQQVAYVWNGEKEENTEIYVKMVGSETALRLTNDPGADLLPAWSADGKQIAFVRVRGTTGIFVISPLGGKERKLFEFTGLDERQPGPETSIVGDLLYPIVSRPSWSADGKYLAIARTNVPRQPGDGSLLLIPANGGEPRTLLSPSSNSNYQHPAFSPDGRQLAFCLCELGTPPCRIQVARLTAGLQIEGEPRTVHTYSGQVRGMTWTADGKSLVVGGFNLPRFYSWRIPVDTPGQPERLELAGADAIWPSMSADGKRLAFTHSILQADLWKMGKGGKAEAFLSSTARDTSPRLSPDGTQVVFQSARSGENEIWAARMDGSDLRQLTKTVGTSSGSPAWSADGKWITFDAARQGGGFDVWVVEASGGTPKRLTAPPGSHHSPAFSPDGKWVYFTSFLGGTDKIWKVPAAGGAMEQVTRDGARTGQIAADGKTLYFLKGQEGLDGIFAVPLAGGETRRLTTDPIVRFSYSVMVDGIYYITPRDAKWCDIKFYSFASRTTTVAMEMERPVAFNISVTPDRKTFVSSRPVTGADLMMIENFR